MQIKVSSWKRVFCTISVLAPSLIGSVGVGLHAQTLAEAYRDYWYTGVSVNQWQVEADKTGANEHDVTGQVSNDQTADWPVITKHFNFQSNFTIFSTNYRMVDDFLSNFNVLYFHNLNNNLYLVTYLLLVVLF